MRKYYPIWKELKEKKVCSIAAHPALHKRIIKAVIEEKYHDLAFKYEMDSIGLWVRIIYKKEGSKITFTLQKHYRLEGITLDQL